MRDYDAIVIGGGHAGIEASLALSREGFETLLITQSLGMPMMTASLRVPDTDDIEYMTHPELIHERYGGVEILIDGGIGGTIPSTIIDCTGDEPVLVRKGLGDIEL